MEALWSAEHAKAHETHRNRAWSTRLARSRCPHALHFWLVNLGSTKPTVTPFAAALLADALPALPALGHLAAMLPVLQELAADRGALTAVDTDALAGALLKIGEALGPLQRTGMAIGAFSALDARIDQLLGAPPPRLPLSPRVALLAVVALLLSPFCCLSAPLLWRVVPRSSSGSKTSPRSVVSWMTSQSVSPEYFAYHGDASITVMHPARLTPQDETHRAPQRSLRCRPCRLTWAIGGYTMRPYTPGGYYKTGPCIARRSAWNWRYGCDTL